MILSALPTSLAPSVDLEADDDSYETLDIGCRRRKPANASTDPDENDYDLLLNSAGVAWEGDCAAYPQE